VPAVDSLPIKKIKKPTLRHTEPMTSDATAWATILFRPDGEIGEPPAR
jgi:hypothetical protein